MGFFSNKSQSSSNESANSKINWNQLTDLGQINDIISLSEQKPVLIFKHSTRCSVSRMALKQFENEFNLEDKVLLYFLDLLEYRSISNEISNRFSVEHQSPQILLINKGEAIFNASHSEIDALELHTKL